MDKKIAIDGLRPFTRIIWKSKEDKVEWEPKIRVASKLYNIAEWLMVAQKKRRCGTLHVNKRNYEGIFKLLTKDGLFFQPIARTASYSGFSHRHITPKPDEDYNVYGAIASKKEDALLFATLSKSREKDMHNQIGELLGYPECCSNAFTKRWSNGIIDPLFEAALVDKQSIDKLSDVKEITFSAIPIETHQMLRYFGLRITSHLPCSLTCKGTIKIGQVWENVMKKHDYKAFNCLKELLTMPLRWDAYRGIVIVTTPHWKGITTTGFTLDKHMIKVGTLDW